MQFSLLIHLIDLSRLIELEFGPADFHEVTVVVTVEERLITDCAVELEVLIRRTLKSLALAQEALDVFIHGCCYLQSY